MPKSSTARRTQSRQSDQRITRQSGILHDSGFGNFQLQCAVRMASSRSTLVTVSTRLR